MAGRATVRDCGYAKRDTDGWRAGVFPSLQFPLRPRIAGQEFDVSY
jgi:hypothetical protein